MSIGQICRQRFLQATGSEGQREKAIPINPFHTRMMRLTPGRRSDRCSAHGALVEELNEMRARSIGRKAMILAKGLPDP